MAKHLLAGKHCLVFRNSPLCYNQSSLEQRMKIHEVQENLRNTIAGKQAMLDGLKVSEKEGYFIIKNWLEINIDELQRILKDVDKAVEQYNELAWTINPDRSGGAFTDEEITRSSEWR